MGFGYFIWKYTLIAFMYDVCFSSSKTGASVMLLKWTLKWVFQVFIDDTVQGADLDFVGFAGNSVYFSV